MIDIIRAIRKIPLDHLDKNSQRRVMDESQKYYWDAPYLCRLGADGVLRRCVPREERLKILRKCHSGEYGGHYGNFRTQAKVWASGFYWLKMHQDPKTYISSCPECERTGNISQRNAMPLNYNLQIDLFNVWGIDFMGHFTNSNGYYHILVNGRLCGQVGRGHPLSKSFNGGIYINDQECYIPTLWSPTNFDK
jgi:hypothetical protein